MAARLRFAKIRCEPPSANGGVNLEDCRENCIRQQQSRLAFGSWGFVFDPLAQVREQRLELVLLVRLRSVVRRPLLLVSGLLDRLSNRHGLRGGSRSVAVQVAVPCDFHREDVFALHLAEFVIRAGTGREVFADTNGVTSPTGLRGNEPRRTLRGQSAGIGDVLTALLASVHLKHPEHD